jgi:hypothetical protein
LGEALPISCFTAVGGKKSLERVGWLFCTPELIPKAEVKRRWGGFILCRKDRLLGAKVRSQHDNSPDFVDLEACHASSQA